jgi:hypothetical protein
LRIDRRRGIRRRRWIPQIAGRPRRKPIPENRIKLRRRGPRAKRADQSGQNDGGYRESSHSIVTFAQWDELRIHFGSRTAGKHVECGMERAGAAAWALRYQITPAVLLREEWRYEPGVHGL